MGCGAAVGACVSNATALVGFFVSPSPVSFDVSLVGSGVIPGIGVGVGVGLGVGVGFRATEGVGVGFVPLEGKFHLTHSINDGISCVGDNFDFHRSSLQSYAIHIEYNYKGRGAFIELSTQTETYFVYPLSCPHGITKVHFAVEHIYNYLKNDMRKEEDKNI